MMRIPKQEPRFLNFDLKKMSFPTIRFVGLWRLMKWLSMAITWLPLFLVRDWLAPFQKPSRILLLAIFFVDPLLECLAMLSIPSFFIAPWEFLWGWLFLQGFLFTFLSGIFAR